jgi:hypothetical protein
MALGSTQPVTEMSTRNISWGQRRPSGPAKACNGIALPFYILRENNTSIKDWFCLKFIVCECISGSLEFRTQTKNRLLLIWFSVIPHNSFKIVLYGNLANAKTYCIRPYQLIIQDMLVIRRCTVCSG